MLHLKADLNNNDSLVLENIADILYGLIELGVFSNNGIDFTNTAVVEAIRADLFEIVELPSKLVKLINKVVNNIEVYGYVPFTWKNMSIKTELSIAKDLITKLNGNIEQTESFSLPIEESTRNILKIKKIGATPSGYPRTYDKMQKELKKLQK